MSTHILISGLDGQVIQEKRIEDFPCRIGRAPLNDIVIDDETVSSEHAVLDREGERLVLVDRGSSNGIVVGEERVPRVEGLHIDCILGQIRFHARLEGAGLEKTKLIDLSELRAKIGKTAKSEKSETEVASAVPWSRYMAVIVGSAALFWLGAWIDGGTDPLKSFQEMNAYLLSAVTVAGLASILRRVISKHFYFMEFFALFFAVLVGEDLLSTLLGSVGYVWDDHLQALETARTGVGYGLGLVTVYFAVKMIYPTFRFSRRVLLILGLVLILGGGGWLAKRERAARLIRYPIENSESLSLAMYREFFGFRAEKRGLDHLMKRVDSTFERAEAVVGAEKAKR